tara:strand:- start:1562 stop:1879 length:318 start_codon:yes stop_codon:yes gene_type:complete
VTFLCGFCWLSIFWSCYLIFKHKNIHLLFDKRIQGVFEDKKYLKALLFIFFIMMSLPVSKIFRGDPELVRVFLDVVALNFGFIFSIDIFFYLNHRFRKSRKYIGP